MKKALIAALVSAAAFSIFAGSYEGTAGLLLNPVTNTYTFEDTVKNIEVNCSECDIKLSPGEDDSIHVVCKEADRIHHTVQVKNDTLMVDRDKDKGLSLSFGTIRELVVEIYLPEKEYEELSVSSSSGDIDIDEDFLFDSITLDSSSGDVECEASASGTLRAETTSGDQEYEGVSAGSVTVHSSSGEISLSTVRCAKADIKASSGDVELEDVIVDGKLEIETSSGEVELRKCDAGSIRIETSSGDVTGSLLSKKNFSTKTSSGDVHIPDSSEGGSCEIRTSSGDIRINVK